MLACFFLLVAFGFALWSNKEKNKIKKDIKIPNAKELLELLRNDKNSLEDLRRYSDIAYTHYKNYMQECNDFDLKFIADLTTHKNVNAKLILEIERGFKNIDPTRKTLLDQALSLGLKNR